MSSKIVNNLDVCDDPLVQVHRALCKWRARWMGLFYDEACKHGDGEKALKYMREGTYKHGLKNGSIYRKRLKSDPVDCVEFSHLFGGGTYRQKALMGSHIEHGKDCLELNFHGCPLLKAWEELGLEDQQCEDLCVTAMTADAAMAAALDLKFDLMQTLADGSPYCRDFYYRGESHPV